MATDPSVLVVCNYNAKKRNHLDPLGETASVTILSAEGQVAGDEFDHVVVPQVGGRLTGILVRLVYAILVARRRDFDLVASISLVPYGLVALVAGRLSGTPTHLGVIGADLDVHAVAWYGPLTRWLLRRFDVVSVTANAYAAQLLSYGLDDGSVTVLTNSIPVDQFAPAEPTARDLDVVWVGKFVEAKDPALFVDAVAALDRRGYEVETAMLGSGPLFDPVRERLAGSGVEDVVSLPGWVDDPSTYLTRSAVYVSTSSRDALPLTMLEAMAAGAVPVAPRIGGIPEVIHHGHNGFLYPQGDLSALVGTLRWVDEEADLAAMREAARRTAGEYGFDVAAEDWRRIVWLATETD